MDLKISQVHGSRLGLVLIGGTPMPGQISMWWNFVARNHDEIDEAHRAWRERDREDRFGHVTSPLPTIDAPTPPWWRAGQA